MVPFLKNFLNNLSAVQSKQVLRILSQMRDRGEIRSAKDFESKLTELAELIQSDQLGQRTPPMTFGPGELLESDAIRSFMEFARLDLEAALGETERLSNSMRAHARLLAENYFDAIEAGLADLEAETRSYEVLEYQKFTGLSSVVKRFTFDGSMSAPGADDNELVGRGGETLYYSLPDSDGGGLRLSEVRANNHVSRLYFDDIEILTDSTTPQTVLSTSTADNIPINAIDGNRDTVWRHSVLLTDDPGVCRLILSVRFTGARRVNLLVIHPVSDVEMRISSIRYIDSGGREVQLPIGADATAVTDHVTRVSPLGNLVNDSSIWVLPGRKKIIDVGDVIARRFIITLQQDTSRIGDFFFDDEDLGNWVRTTEPEAYVNGILRESGTPPGYESMVALGMLDEKYNGRRQMRAAEYVFGFKDILALSKDYYPAGFFAPESFVMKTAPTVLGLYSDASFPANEDTDIEFLLHKENYDSAGFLLDIESIPMLPYGTESIKERLFLSELHTAVAVDDTGVLRFYPDFSESFEVIKDGSTTLTIGTDYEVSVDGGATFETSLPPTSTPTDPKTCLVKITGITAGLTTGSIYTVVYSPLVSTSEAGGEVWLNAEHTVRLGRFQNYVFDNLRSTGEVDNCKMQLRIVLRANTLNTRVSPHLKEVFLLGG